MDPSPDIFLWLWLAFVSIWLVAATRVARTVSTQSAKSRLLQVFLLGVGVALTVVQIDTPHILAWRVLPFGPSQSWIGLIFVVGGLSFALWARFYLGRFWSGAVTLKEDHALVRTGPYAVARHPIYTGLLTAFLGTAIARGTVGAAIGVGATVLALALKIAREEQLLSQHFGVAYQDYRSCVRAVIPYVW